MAIKKPDGVGENETVYKKYYPKQEKYKGEFKIKNNIPWTEKQIE